jgi:hypothetical protein
MIPFAVWPYNDCLVAAVVAIGSERAFKLVKEVDAHLAAYEICESSRALQDFSDVLSNW